MSGSPDLARASTLSCEVPTFLNRAQSAQLRSPDRLAVVLKARDTEVNQGAQGDG